MRIRRRSKAMRRESLMGCTLDCGEFIHFTGSSAILRPFFCARKRSSTSNANLSTLWALNKGSQLSLLNSLKPHCVSTRPLTVRSRTSLLNVLPISTL